MIPSFSEAFQPRHDGGSLVGGKCTFKVFTKFPQDHNMQRHVPVLSKKLKSVEIVCYPRNELFHFSKTVSDSPAVKSLMLCAKHQCHLFVLPVISYDAP